MLGVHIDDMHAAAAAAKLLQSCPTLCDPTDSSPPGSAVPGIFQARVLEWGAIVFSKIIYIVTRKLITYKLNMKLDLKLLSSHHL